MIAGLFDGPEVIVVLVVVLVLFGGSRIPKLAKNLGQAQKEFKKGLSEGAKDDDDSKSEWLTDLNPDGSGSEFIESSDRLYGDTATFADATTFAFAATTPHTVIDVIFKGVFQASGGHRTGRANFAGLINTHPIAGEKCVGRVGAASAFGHPVGYWFFIHEYFSLCEGGFRPLRPMRSWVLGDPSKTFTGAEWVPNRCQLTMPGLGEPVRVSSDT
jgi:sec-independent protein translocase protein TatA